MPESYHTGSENTYQSHRAYNRINSDSEDGGDTAGPEEEKVDNFNPEELLKKVGGYVCV